MHISAYVARAMWPPTSRSGRIFLSSGSATVDDLPGVPNACGFTAQGALLQSVVPFFHTACCKSTGSWLTRLLLFECYIDMVDKHEGVQVRCSEWVMDGDAHERVLAHASALLAFWSGVICLGRGRSGSLLYYQ
jgi:hypothetical protein